MKTKLALRSEAGEVERLVVGAIALAGSLIWFTIKAIIEHADFLSGLWKVVSHNVGFWIVFLLAASFGFYRKMTNHGEFMWKELPIQLGVSSLVIVSLYGLFFSVSTDLVDTEILNGYVQRAEYYEAWTQKVTVKTKDGTSTTYIRHPPEWRVVASVGECSTTSEAYDAYRNRFGGEKKKILIHIDQSSIGDGNMYIVECDKGEKLLPASLPHSYVNYLRASDSVRKLRGNIAGFKNLLREYPSVHGSVFGDIAFDRVIVEKASVPETWTKAVDYWLDTELMTLGSRKEVNVVVYVVGSSDRKFASALKEFWSQGKKNDVVVVIGASRFPKADWVEVLSWTKVEEFPITLRNSVSDLPDLSDPKALAYAIVNQINKPASLGGYVRRPMSDYDYLIADISLPWWCQVVIVLLGGVVSWFTSVWLVNNDWRDWNPRSWSSRYSKRRAW